MHNATEKLIQHWLSQGLAITKGNTQEQIEEFEQRYNVSVPPDMRDYLLRVDGMDMNSLTSYQDKAGFSFWPRKRIKTAAEEAHDHTTGYWSFRDQNSLFLFADYLDWSWAYAIRLLKSPSAETPVFIIGKRESPIEIAKSFSEFVDLYVVDSPILYNAAT